MQEKQHFHVCAENDFSEREKAFLAQMVKILTGIQPTLNIQLYCTRNVTSHPKRNAFSIVWQYFGFNRDDTAQKNVKCAKTLLSQARAMHLTFSTTCNTIMLLNSYTYFFLISFLISRVYHPFIVIDVNCSIFCDIDLTPYRPALIIVIITITSNIFLYSFTL